MKKIFFSLFTISFLFACVIFGCKFSDEDDLLSAPSIEVTSDGKINVSREKLSDSTKYVNVDRISSQSNSEIVRIGTIYPEYVTESILIFDDSLVYSGITYMYRFVYVDSDGSKYPTDWSNARKAENSLTSDNTSFSYDTSSKSITYVVADYTLRLDDTLTAPDSSDTAIDSRLAEYEPAVILSTSTESRAFPLESSSSGTILSLKNVLPESFYDTAITLKGITGTYEKADVSEENVAVIYWLEPASIQLNLESTIDDTTETKENLESFTISSLLGDGGIEY